MKTVKNVLFYAIFLSLTAACGNGNGDYDASGTFESTEIIVSAEANGKIMRFNVEEGDLLKDGQEVGYIDTVQLYLKKMQLLTSVNCLADKAGSGGRGGCAGSEARFSRKRC